MIEVISGHLNQLEDISNTLKEKIGKTFNNINYLPNDMLISSSTGAWIIDCGCRIRVDANIVWPSGFCCTDHIEHALQNGTIQESITHN